MKKLTVLLSLFAALALASPAFGQANLTQTTLSAAVANTSTTTVVVASATGVTANSTLIFVDLEAMFVNTVNGTTLGVTRGYNGTVVGSHISGSRVLLGPPQQFYASDPSGGCTAANTLVTPYLNIKNGNQWLCSTVLNKWVPGWGNSSQQPQPTAAVASAAGLVTPSGPLFHITGALAITGFTIPLGFPVKGGQTFCVIPDGTFTTTTANNIALASTAVVNKTLCFTYDTANAKFTPSY